MSQAQVSNGRLTTVRTDLLSGITVALALIPEAIAFSIIAGVDPMVGLYASFCIAMITAIAGGRPAMISAATGAMALVLASLVREHGFEYMLAATILTGVLQFLMGLLKLGRFITFVPHPVMLGFVNALGILIFTAQLPHFKGAGWQLYALVALTLAIIYILPRFTKAVPSPLVAIVVVGSLAVALGVDLKTVGDMGDIRSTLPLFHLPEVPLSLETLRIIFPYSLSLALVGIMESLLTATLVDELTDTKSNKNREIKGQGLANFVTGLFGGMAGCAMIGQTVINVRSGGRTRLSTFTAGVFLLILIMLLADIVKQIPMAALVGVMIMVSFSTFNWSSLKLHQVPRGDAVVMLITVAIVLVTHDLSKGVIAGVLVSALLFAWKAAHIKAEAVQQKNGAKLYRVSGPLFFATVSSFAELFDYSGDPETVTVDFTHSQVWDQSAVTAVGKLIAKYEQAGKKVSITGLNEHSRRLVEQVGLSGSSGAH
ncbi:SulP family inorganic anion transporter [Paenibacillus sp. y28]|uniref:SulP family inorganic anion transporter n=1 Tax=Paenibacillus sp. y28 TaxID=3129110 RepID=UPI003016946C